MDESIIFSLKKNRCTINDWENFKQIATYFPEIIFLQTGKSKTKYYIKVVAKKTLWKSILAKGTQFDYVPGGANNKIVWNKIKLRINLNKL
jgi:hypothetical protein